MLKSVWLVKIIIESLSSDGNPLRNSFDKLSKVFNSDNIEISLFEPNNKLATSIIVSHNNVIVNESPNKDECYSALYNLQENLMQYNDNDHMYLPLKTKNTKVFGYLKLEHTEKNRQYEFGEMLNWKCKCNTQR